MEDLNLIAILIPTDEKELAKSAFRLPHNSARYLPPRSDRCRTLGGPAARTLDGPLFKVTVGHRALIKPAVLRAIDAEFRLN